MSSTIGSGKRVGHHRLVGSGRDPSALGKERDPGPGGTYRGAKRESHDGGVQLSMGEVLGEERIESKVYGKGESIRRWGRGRGRVLGEGRRAK